MKRMLSDEFKNDLQSGYLNVLLKHVLADNTLMLAIREDYVNVYYRGGNILKLSKKGAHEYDAFFDKKYATGQSLALPDSPSRITSETEIRQWIESFPIRKQVMDFWFTKNPKMEREFQQLVVRENNFSSISNATEYFIADIELADSETNARFDMLAFKWPSTERKADKVQLALIEMKYGDDALTGTSGIINHLRQFDELLCNPKSRQSLREMAEKQINQLNELGLISHTKKEGRNFSTVDDRFEVIFLFANHNPRSSVLLRELESDEFSSLAKKLNEYCDIRFFIANSAGYGMHKKCMVDIDSYIESLKKLR